MNKSYRKVGMPTQSYRKIANEVNPARALVHSPGFGMAALVLVHPFLALAMRASSLLATAHALFTLALGLSFALFSKDTRKVGYVAAYIAGAEVLWRMTNAQIYWEAGKFFTILILGIALFRIKPWQRTGLPILYFGLLSMSIPLVLSRLGTSSEARDAISFNLSGPFALMMCALYFSQITLDQNAMQRMAWWVILPILGIATLTASGTLSAGSIVFTDKSNFATSGGFGPNQVSAILGLGGGLALLLFLTGKGFASRWFTIFLAFGFLTLSALTFSRGGLYNAAIMAVLALAHNLRDTRRRFAAILALLIIGLIGGYIIFPRLNAFTGGMFGQRFSDLNTTSRTEIAQADLDVWYANPVLGVGPGISKTERIFGFGFASHTEYTRVLAEHGSAGLLSLLVLFWMAARAYLRAPNVEAQTWIAALMAWPLLEMTHAAMRVVAISFLFGLALVNWEIRVAACRISRKPTLKSGILLVGNFLSGHGYTRQFIEDLADHMENAGWSVICTSKILTRPLRLMDMIFTILASRNKYVVGHIVVFSGPAFLWAEISSWVLKVLRKPFVLSLHGGSLPVFARRWPGRVRHLLNSAVVVIAPSRYLLEQMRPYQSELRLLPNPLNVRASDFRSRSKPHPALIWLRSFHKIYNPSLAAEVVARLASDIPEVHLTMVGPDKGDGSLQLTQQVAKDLGVSEKIHFPGRVTKTEVPTWLQRGDIFINTTDTDNTPISVLEAMACGLCVVSTNVGGIPYLLNDEEDSLLVPPNDPAAMAAAVRRILTEPGLAVRLSTNARHKVEQFDWSVILPQWEALFSEVVNQYEGMRS